MKASSIFLTALLPFNSQAWIGVTPLKLRKCTILSARTNSPPPDKHGDEQPQQRFWLSRREWLAAATASATTATVVSSFGKSAQAADTVSTIHTCDPSISVWRQPETGRKVYIVGTAHISTTSAELAGKVVDDVRPDAVFVELDAKRVLSTPVERPASQPPTSSLADKTLTRDTSGSTRATPTWQSERAQSSFQLPTKSNQVILAPEPPSTAIVSNAPGMSKPALAIGSAAVGSAIKGMYGRLGDAGFKPGEEFVIAIQEGQKVGAKVILGDRDVEVTLSRLSEALRQTDWRLLLSPDSELEASMKALLPNDMPIDSRDENFKNELTAYVETMKAKENVNMIMAQLRRLAPEMYQALVAERDVYMANGLDKLNMFPVIVAVMGIAHVDGVETYLKGHGWMPEKLKCKDSANK